MAKKWKKKEIEDYISTKQISQENYVAPTVQTNYTPSVASTVDAFNSVQPTIKSVDSTIDNKFSFSIDNKKEEPTTGQKLGFVGKSAGAGLVSGLTGIADAPLQNVQEGAQKGKKKGKLENYLQGLARTLDIYGLSTMPETAKEVQQIAQDKNKKGWQKALNIGGAILNNNPLVQNLEAAGQQLNIFDKNAEKDIKKTREIVETPSNKLNESVAKDSEKMSGGWKIAGEVSQTIGNMIPSMALTAVTKNPDIGLAAMGVSAKGQATKEAEERGADLNTANEIGLGKGLVEVGTEKLTGGLKFFGKGTADDLVEKGINKAIKNKVGNFIAKQAVGMAGEVGEETISDLVGTAIDKATVDPNASYSFDDWKKTALMTMLSTGALNTISGGYGRKAYQLNAEELNDIAQSKKVQDTVNERVEQFKTPDMTPEQVEQLREQTTAVVLGEIQQNVDDILDSSIAQLQEQPQIPTQTPINTLSSNIQEQNNQILGQQETPQITPLNQVNQELQETRQQDVADSVRAMNLEQEPQFTQKQGNYVYEKSDNSKIDNLRKDAATYLKEGEQTTNFVNTLEKLVKDKDIEIRFDTKLGNNVNGTYKNGVITINPNSNRAGEFVAIHELTHAIGTKPMIDMIQTYRKSNAEFNNAVERLLSTYKTTEINEEALGDIAGQLFGNQEYINNLSMENPSLFKKIYNEIKYLWHQFRGYKNQDQFIEDLRNKWESAYRNQKIQQKAKNSNIEMSNQTDSNGNMLSNEQVDYFKNSKVRDKDGNLLVMYHGTNEEFNVFKPSKWAKEISGDNQIKGYFATDNSYSEIYGKTNPYYLNINNPLYMGINGQEAFTLNEWKDFFKKHGIDDIKFDSSLYGVNTKGAFSDADGNTRYLAFEIVDSDEYWAGDGNVTEKIKQAGYDGLTWTEGGTSYMPFNANQIKNIDNLTPTKSDDIRYSKEEAKQTSKTGYSINEAKSLLTNKKGYDLGTYQDGLSKTDKSYKYNKVYTYDIANGGKGDNVQVSVTKNGYVWNNALLSDNVKGKGEGTKIALDLNQQSLEETGKPLRSLPEYNIVGIKNHTEEGKGLWDSLVRKGYAIKNADNTYTMLENAVPQNDDIRYSKNEELDNSSFSVQEKLTNIKNQREDLRQEMLDLRKQRADIIDKIPNYKMFTHYEELDGINKQLDENHQKSVKLYEEQQKLEKQVEEIKQQEKQKKIDEINKKTTPFKDKQFKIIQKSNPMLDDYHTGIRQPGEIRTWTEAMYDAEKDGEGYSWGDFTKEDAEKALKNKTITIYSSYPIKNGVFVTPSRIQAEQYAGGEGSRVYSKTVRPDRVAWINVDEGQYADAGINTYEAKYSKDTKGWTDYVSNTFTKDNTGRELSKQQQEYFKDSKVRDENGNLLIMNHATSNNSFTIFDENKQGTNSSNFKQKGELGRGFYFSDEQTAYTTWNDYVERQTGKPVKGMSVYLKINNPFYYSTSELNKDVKNYLKDKDVIMSRIKSNADIIKFANFTGLDIQNMLKELGYDGIIERDDNNIYQAVVFNSNQIKNIDNLTPTEDPDIRYSKDNQTWREYLEKEFPSQGTRTNLQDINERNKPKQENKTTQEEKPQEMPKNEVKQEVKKSYLTSAEQNELDGLRDLDNSGFAELTKEEQARMEELEKKSQGITKKFPELKKTVTQEDTKPLYFKYKDNEISRENNKILNEAKNIVEANKQGKRTKEQWLQVAEYIGSNADIKNSTDLQKLAMETWLASRPNTKDNLNRQGKKYVDFKTNEWFNAMYKGAGVGTDVKMSLEEATDTKGNKVDLKPSGNNTYEQVNVKPKKNDVIPDMSNKVLNIGNEKVSNFYSNITEKSKFITEENRESLKDNENLKYYDAITNKDTLGNAMDKLNKNPDQQIGEFFTKKEFTPEDVATGWILVKRYQDAGNFDAMSNVIEKMREQGTKAGQTVQMYGILQRLTPEGMEYYSQKQLDNAFNKFSENKSKKQIEKYAKDFTLTAEEHQFIKDTMEKVGKMTDEDAKKVEVAKIVSMLSDKLPPEKGQRLKAWMRISMLGNPKTQVRNVMGNAIIQPVNWVGDVFSATADKIISKKTGIRTKGQTDFGALTGGFIKGGKEAIRDAKTGVDTRDINLDRFEENIGAKPFYEGHKSKVLNLGAKALNKTNKILGNVMSGGDRIFYQAIYENSLKNQMKLNKVTTPTQEMIDIATNEALSRTWNDSNEYTKAVLQIRSALNKLNVKGYGLGDVLIPFAKTPANLTKAIVDYSPVGLTRSILQDGKNLKNSLENGQYNAKLQHKFADSLGKGVAGTMLYIAAYSLAKAGITTGASDDDKDVANFMRNTLGIQPYSVKIGDKSFTYDWAQPIAAPFAITADYKRITEKENQDLSSALKSAVSSGSNILLEQSFLSSIQDVFNNYNGPTEAIMDQIKGLPARATPTFFKQIADMVDPTKRQTFEKGQSLGENIKNQVIAKLPEASKSLESQRDTLGREIEKYGGNEDKIKYAFNVFLNPANTQKGKPSEAAEEIYEVYKATGDKTIMPRQVGYSENIGGTWKNLTSKERIEWQKLSGEKIEENVSALTSNSKYNAMSDEDKAAVINGIVNYSYAKAKSDLFGTNISTMYRTAAKKEEQGIALYDYYVDRVSKRR